MWPWEDTDTVKFLEPEQASSCTPRLRGSCSLLAVFPSVVSTATRVLFFFFLMEVELIYHVVLVSGIKQSDSVIYIYFFRLFSIIGYYKILNVVPCAIQ